MNTFELKDIRDFLDVFAGEFLRPQGVTWSRAEELCRENMSPQSFLASCSEPEECKALQEKCNAGLPRGVGASREADFVRDEWTSLVNSHE